jgi:hypothetical protein
LSCVDAGAASWLAPAGSARTVVEPASLDRVTRRERRTAGGNGEPRREEAVHRSLRSTWRGSGARRGLRGALREGGLPDGPAAGFNPPRGPPGRAACGSSSYRIRENSSLTEFTESTEYNAQWFAVSLYTLCTLCTP